VRRSLSAFLQAVVTATHNLAAALLGIAVVLVFYQVVTRFVVGESSTWSEVLARGVIIWCVFLSSAASFRLGAMISIEALLYALPKAAQRWIHRLVTTLTLTFFGVLAWNGWLMMRHVVSQQIAMLDISIAWFYAAIPCGAVFAALAVAMTHVEREAGFRGEAAARAAAAARTEAGRPQFGGQRKEAL